MEKQHENVLIILRVNGEDVAKKEISYDEFSKHLTGEIQAEEAQKEVKETGRYIFNVLSNNWSYDHLSYFETELLLNTFPEITDGEKIIEIHGRGDDWGESLELIKFDKYKIILEINDSYADEWAGTHFKLYALENFDLKDYIRSAHEYVTNGFHPRAPVIKFFNINEEDVSEIRNYFCPWEVEFDFTNYGV
ncbi:MAG: hypothetical protein KM296_00320 [Brockia lithotrophica]|nr:hypothetical protein [Brockia lithotrophica]